MNVGFNKLDNQNQQCRWVGRGGVLGLGLGNYLKNKRTLGDGGVGGGIFKLSKVE